MAGHSDRYHKTHNVDHMVYKNSYSHKNRTKYCLLKPLKYSAATFAWILNSS